MYTKEQVENIIYYMALNGQGIRTPQEVWNNIPEELQSIVTSSLLAATVTKLHNKDLKYFKKEQNRLLKASN